jgi:hypothetical protein
VLVSEGVGRKIRIGGGKHAFLLFQIMGKVFSHSFNCYFYMAYYIVKQGTAVQCEGGDKCAL